MARSLCWIAVTAALASAAGGACARDLPSIQTPSHNIFCLATSAGDGLPTELRCDVQQMTNRPPRPPADCPLNWGDSFYVDLTGPGGLMCHGDTVRNPATPVIAYGASWSIYGFACLSQTTGLTCRNPQGHGFSISREAQKVF
jgi:hypothetical protein